jgi:hypothetical protein
MFADSFIALATPERHACVVFAAVAINAERGFERAGATQKPIERGSVSAAVGRRWGFAIR